MREGEILHCINYSARIKKDSELGCWTRSKTTTPFHVYINGTAVISFGSLRQAVRYIEKRFPGALFEGDAR